MIRGLKDKTIGLAPGWCWAKVGPYTIRCLITKYRSAFRGEVSPNWQVSLLQRLILLSFVSCVWVVQPQLKAWVPLSNQRRRVNVSKMILVSGGNRTLSPQNVNHRVLASIPIRFRVVNVDQSILHLRPHPLLFPPRQLLYVMLLLRKLVPLHSRIYRTPPPSNLLPSTEIKFITNYDRYKYIIYI